ncbi:MAG: signal peptidase II [candidate division SR1 bacterium CG_4_9_14_3_um_filter_40_9]|nr:MAG: signal peptidase II [candidate division SR1 bacterium CG_4_9_14_3_um_filter_40_9]
MITVLLLIIDVASKYFFYDLQFGKEIAVIDPSFNLGIARSMGLPLIITIVISLVALVLFFVIYYRGYINIIIAGFLIAGALGNLMDRLWFGGVRDFINIRIWDFPIFNIADVFLNIGIILFIIKEIWPGKKKLKT